MRQTEDDILVAVHRWEQWKKQTDYDKNILPSHNEFKNLKYFKWRERIKMELFTFGAVASAVKNGITPILNWRIVKLLIINDINDFNKFNLRYVVSSYDTCIENENIFKNMKDRGVKIYIFGGYGKNFDKNCFYYGRYINNTKVENK